jgi:hypothetical protein
MLRNGNAVRGDAAILQRGNFNCRSAHTAARGQIAMLSSPQSP